ncbi:AAA family ATPase [Streptomyces sp. ISL-10]|uniref:helix-turn-helix transcriptional regulator n=1 Tax=Streptomyces sp. ISL-10 TaxID=2819172 RepID=UPI001BE6C844|nr:LuxR family transcriptional regulator [Streptomyces sp. ISL-10]MBT2369135.1 AAA family ATPase [Streptomyces sp. ISL-10]
MTYGAENPIVGRRNERRELVARLEACRRGDGGALLLTGNPGIGKTALLRYATHLEHDIWTLCADGVQAEQTLGYGAVQRLVRPLAGDLRGVPPPCRQVAERLLRGLVPPPAERSLVPVALLELLATASGRRPVLVRVDDLQWVDAESRYALGFVARRISTERVVILAATDGDAAALMPGVPVLHLLGMNDRDCLRLIARYQPSPVAPAVREVLVHTAGGNPLVLLELLRTLDPAQLSQLFRLPDPLPLGPCLAHLRLGPFRRLPEDCRRLLVLLAAEPRLDLPSLFRVALQVGITPAALKPAVAGELVTVDQATVSFRRADLPDAIYRGVDLTDRHWAHTLLARVFADTDDHRRWWHEAALLPGADAHLADELERQATQARRRGEYAHAGALMARSAELTVEDAHRGTRLLAAADVGRRSGRLRHAARLLERAKTLVGADAMSVRGHIAYLHAVISQHCAAAPDACDRMMDAADALAGADPALAVKALVAAGETGLHAGDTASLVRAGERVPAVLDASCEPVQPETRWSAGILLAVADSFQDRLREAVPRLREHLAAATSMDDPVLLVWGSQGALFVADDLRARSLATRAVARAREERDTPTMAYAMQYLAYPECWLNGPEAATLTATEALRLAHETGQLHCVRTLMGMLMLAAGLAGDAETCEQYADRVVGDAAAGVGLAPALGLWGLAHLDLASGNWSEAAARLHRLTRTRQGHPGIALEAAPTYVEAAVRAGHRPRAERAAASFIRWAEAIGRGWPAALAARCRALLEADHAEEHFRLALHLHPPGDRELERARTALLYGEHLNRERRRADARAHLREAAEVFRRHRARLWLDRTRAELRAAGDDGPTEDTDSAGPSSATGMLTSRQHQIILLVAKGATNKEVAARLCLSPRTVDYHLRRIFERLGVTSRADLIRRFATKPAPRT